jgi:hypothetical protein
LPHEILERGGRSRAVTRRGLHRIGASVERNDLVAALNQTGRHVRAHLPETHHP